MHGQGKTVLICVNGIVQVIECCFSAPPEISIVSRVDEMNVIHQYETSQTSLQMDISSYVP